MGENLMAEPIKINIYRNNSIDELTSHISNPDDRANTGSAAAASAALAAALLARAAAACSSTFPQPTEEDKEKLNWYVRNTEILRSYMINLVDEDVKCHGPLRRALKEGEPQRIEASRQAAVSICLEIVNMMGICLEIAEGLIPFTDSVSRANVAACADLAYGASHAAGHYVLSLSEQSADDTYRYVMQRENELTMQQQSAIYQRLITSPENR